MCTRTDAGRYTCEHYSAVAHLKFHFLNILMISSKVTERTRAGPQDTHSLMHMRKKTYACEYAKIRTHVTKTNSVKRPDGYPSPPFLFFILIYTSLSLKHDSSRLKP
ncbi:hypothetical protein POVWA1_012550 [Plasmodium ovale wallikeri]|uniref:Uncharacterized protein n=1 Tax=Plasmodium ovale wallikeri TaxID=864142 RepID=A0A1A8YMD7_PLAOA|nr:hypothetical protein POVWA1_012550 [Plasmodium ovale wallikeri]